MASRSRKFCVETLEGRRLLSHAIASPPGDVSALAISRPKTVVVSGTIRGPFASNPTTFTEAYKASGTLRGLGAVQMSETISTIGTDEGHGALMLTTNSGTLTFSSFAPFSRGPIKAKLTSPQGTGAYAGWTGGGTVVMRVVKAGVSSNAFSLKLKT